MAILQKQQGFEKDVCRAISEQYLPAGFNSKVPKETIIALHFHLADKIDTLVGFFGINQKANKLQRSICFKKASFRR